MQLFIVSVEVICTYHIIGTYLAFWKGWMYCTVQNWSCFPACSCLCAEQLGTTPEVQDSSTHLLGTCRHNCSWSCSCHRSIGTGNGLPRQAGQKAGGREPHTSLHHTMARPNASSYRKGNWKDQYIIYSKLIIRIDIMCLVQSYSVFQASAMECSYSITPIQAFVNECILF